MAAKRATNIAPKPNGDKIVISPFTDDPGNRIFHVNRFIKAEWLVLVKQWRVPTFNVNVSKSHGGKVDPI